MVDNRYGIKDTIQGDISLEMLEKPLTRRQPKVVGEKGQPKNKEETQ